MLSKSRFSKFYIQIVLTYPYSKFQWTLIVAKYQLLLNGDFSSAALLDKTAPCSKENPEKQTNGFEMVVNGMVSFGWVGLGGFALIHQISGYKLIEGLVVPIVKWLNSDPSPNLDINNWWCWKC